jgi:stalled ribosome alternative rescue factor ArfA
MTAVPFAARFTWVVEAPSEGTVSGVPSLPVKFTSNEAGELVELVKYRAEYQPPPNANCGSTLDAVRAGSASLVGRERGIALNDVDARHRNIEFVGDNLRKRGANAGTEVNLAQVRRHHAFLIDREKRVDLVGRDALRRRQVLRNRVGNGSSERKRNHTGTAALEKVTPRRGKAGIHDLFS